MKINKHFPVDKHLDCNGVEILANEEFKKSVREVHDLTLLDTHRLANLWSFCQMSDPGGVIVEIGSYKGGGALHLSNSSPNRKVYVFDSFIGFNKVDPVVDDKFNMLQFVDTSYVEVKDLFVKRGRDAVVVSGFFPYSACNILIPKISFAHIDVDTYDSTKNALDYILKNDLMMKRSFIVVDDFRRGCIGIDKALLEIEQLHNKWRVFPLFPSQALLVPGSLYD